MIGYYNRDPNIKARKRREFINQGSTLCSCAEIRLLKIPCRSVTCALRKKILDNVLPAYCTLGIESRGVKDEVSWALDSQAKAKV